MTYNQRKRSWNDYTVLLTYGIDVETGELRHIDDVPNGDACGCVCPACESPLCAKQGRVLAHHFSHVSTECRYAIETALHLAAKSALRQSKCLWLPALRVDYIGEYKNVEREIFHAQALTFEAVDLEMPLGDIKPDLLMRLGSTSLMVEIAVSHFVDEAKREKIEASGIGAVEIDLSHFEYLPTIAEMQTWLAQENAWTRWIYSPKQHAEYAKARANDVLTPEEQQQNYERRVSALASMDLQIDLIANNSDELRAAYHHVENKCAVLETQRLTDTLSARENAYLTEARKALSNAHVSIPALIVAEQQAAVRSQKAANQPVSDGQLRLKAVKLGLEGHLMSEIERLTQLSTEDRLTAEDHRLLSILKQQYDILRQAGLC